MFNPEFSRQAQSKFPVDMEVSKSRFQQSFFHRLLANLRNYWEAEIIPPIVDYPEMYAFRFLIK